MPLFVRPGRAAPLNLYGILYILSGIPTAMHATGVPVSPATSVKLGFGKLDNRTSFGIPVLNISNIDNSSSQSAPPVNNLKALGEGPTENRSSVTTSLPLDITLEPPGSILDRVVAPEYFYKEGRLIIECHEPKDVLLVGKGIFSGDVTPNTAGVAKIALTKFMEAYQKDIIGDFTKDHLHAVIQRYHEKCFACRCNSEGKLIAGQRKIDKEIRKCRASRASLCEVVLGCYCVATLIQPTIALQGPLQIFLDAINQIPPNVRYHERNRGWGWIVPPELAGFPGQVIPVEDPPLIPPEEHRSAMNPAEYVPAMNPVEDAPAMDLAGYAMGPDMYDFGNDFMLNTAPSGEPPYYLSGPAEEEDPYNYDPGEGSSTGAVRHHNPYGPPDPHYGYPYGYGDGSGYFPPPSKRDVSLKNEIVEKQEA
ncbi:uncharacterized protein DFL_009189 [Arthrobotrys flagrans]|uniref:Uncharacterized protein n=1 Tax=Arthrobotrys flagrans TaxID=97331 RepID=A0A436ZRB1_ARTFL|nr:hypothetical protein DFL_009189 [Arthrobotrys flagrans]